MLSRKGKGTAQVVRAGDLIPDNRLLPGEADLLEHEAIAKGVAEIALTAMTPVNIALFGAWGSGKSSIYTMVKKHLDEITSKRVRTVRYDAWKYGGKELKRNFLGSLAKDLELDNNPELSMGLELPVIDTRIEFGTWFRRNKVSLLYGLLFAIGVASLWVTIIAGATWASTDTGFGAAAKALIPDVGPVFGLALLAALLGPKALDSASVTTEIPAPEGADQFANRFKTLVDMARRGSAPHPLVVFIDELDRCAPTDVVATLRDLKTFLDQPNCAFVVAADREVIVRALREEAPQAKPIREEEPYYATPGAFLDKIFQHQIALPPLRARAMTEFARALADAQEGGVWEEMRKAGADCYDRTIFALIPVHVRSPRRAKVLLNNFATNARIAEARGIPWLERVHEIAVLTVLQTEFPSVVGHLRRVPRLLTYIRGDDVPAASEVCEIVARYVQPRGVPSTEESRGELTESAPDDEIINDDDSAAGRRAEQIAGETLRRQLNTYLGKIAAARIQDPRPDLLYLKPAANRDRLPDPKLGDAIDFATDTAPEQVVDAFDGHDSATLAIAIPLLVMEGDNTVGPGRQFAYESACLLVERLDPDDFQSVASQAHPSLLAALSAGALSRESLPGALLVAAWSGVHEPLRRFFEGDHLEDLSDDLLRRFTPLLPHVEEADAALIVRLLADGFGAMPQPLLTALSDAPISTACELWEEISGSIITTINELELPTPAPESSKAATAQPPAGQPGHPVDTAAPETPAASEATGNGVALLNRLVETALDRADGEPLVSAIFSSFQTRPAKTPMVQWTLANADRVVAPMDSPERKARHALLGVRAFKSGAWARWLELLPEQPRETTGAGLGELAASLITQKLLPAFAASPDSMAPAELAKLTQRVSRWASMTDDQLVETGRAVVAELAWSEANDADARERLWATKRSLYEVLLQLAADAELDGPVPAIVVDDLTAVLTAYDVDNSVVEPFVQVCEAIGPELCGAVSQRVDAYEMHDDEQAWVMLLRLLIRGLSGGEPVPASELLDLDESKRTTTISGAWFALAPTSDEAARLLRSYPLTPATLGTYSDQLNLDERSNLWIQAEKLDLSDQLLRSIGRSGVDSTAVEHIRRVIPSLRREPERSAKVKRLQLATAVAPTEDASALRRAAEALARDLLNKDVSGDVRTAAELMCWAGGAARGTKMELRELFDEQIKVHRNSVTKTLFSEMEGLGLVSKKKSLRELVFGPRD